MKQRVLIAAATVITALGGGLLCAQQVHPRPSRTPSSLQPQSSTSQQGLASQAFTAASVPLIAPPVASPAFVAANTSTLVTVTVQILDPALLPSGVNLLRIGATGTQPIVLGVMHDDGANGDAIAGDHVYTLQTTFHEVMPGAITLQVSAAVRGQLKRATSPLMQVAVWGSLTDATSGFSTLYPPGLYNLIDTSTPSIFSLQSSPGGVAIGGVAPEDGSNATTSGFSVIIEAAKYGGSFDINTWLTTAAPYSEIDSLTPTTINALPAYVITFKNQIGAGRPTVVVYRHGYVYQISYASTFAPGSAADQNGLNAFNLILQNFTLF
jgi:hypothetical protein